MMEISRKYQIERFKELDVQCPFCKATIGAPCITKKNGNMTTFHADRYRLALQKTSKRLQKAKFPRSNRLPKQAKKRDGYACVKCGGTESLEASHIRPLYLGGMDTLDNLEILCNGCHREHELSFKDSDQYYSNRPVETLCPACEIKGQSPLSFSPKHYICQIILSNQEFFRTLEGR